MGQAGDMFSCNGCISGIFPSRLYVFMGLEVNNEFVLLIGDGERSIFKGLISSFSLARLDMVLLDLVYDGSMFEESSKSSKILYFSFE